MNGKWLSTGGGALGVLARWIPGGVLAAALCMSPAARAADLPDMKVGEFKLGKGDAVLRGDAKCTACHDETEKYPVLAIGKTKHGTAADGRTPTCVTCHGPSEEHMRKKADQKERPKPDVTFGGQYASVEAEAMVDRYFGKFGRATSTPVADRNATCMGCHKGGNRMHWDGSTHANRGVGCTNCHQIHTAHDRVRSRQSQTELCFTCHKEQRALLNKPSHHPIIEGKMGCADCHNVHSNTPKQLKKDSINETCYQCHMEKRGPFLHNHQPVTEDCTICHTGHGSNIFNLLKARPPYLCQECHSHDSHPGQIAGIPTGRTTSTTLLGAAARGCLNCHTNIHGGNSTQNNATAGRFRR